MTKVHLALIACLVLCERSATAETVAAQPLLGILEDRPGVYANEPRRFVIRVAFHKDARGWKAFDAACADQPCLKKAVNDFPKATKWTISLAGKQLGEVTGQRPEAWSFYADIGEQELAPGSRPPTVGERSPDHATFADTASYRPLAATSPGAFSDPENWTQSKLPPKVTQTLRQQFRQQFPRALNCDDTDRSTPHSVTYKDSDIAIDGVYISAKKWTIATLHLSNNRCDGPTADDDPYSVHEFVVAPDGGAKFLGPGLIFLDAGDFDGDGHSELLFQVLGYNLGGYELYSADFASRARFTFSYH